VDESEATVALVVASPDVRVAMLAVCPATVGERPATTLEVDCKSEVKVEMFPFAAVTLLESVEMLVFESASEAVRLLSGVE
jgi:hypothetical protein